MNNYVSDFLVNICLFLFVWLVAHNRLPQRKLFWLRYVLCFAAFCILRYLYFTPFVALFSHEVGWWVKLFGFAFLIFLLVGAIIVCYKSDLWKALFCGTTSYCAQHVCQRTYMVISTLWMKEVHAAFHIMLFLALIALIAFILWLFVRYRGKDDIVIDKKLLLIIVCLIFLSTVVLELLCLRSLSNRAMVRAYVTLFGIIIAILSFSLEFSLANSKRNAMERDAIKKILSEANEQYRFEKSMIDLVNVKYHDLKHQLAALDEISKKKLEEDIQPIVEAYDSSFKTGNAALDVILTKENFTCKRKGIELTCAVNGNGLDFMWETEVYSLFGNILDNAIDATERLEDAEKRVISLSVRRQNNFLYISSENYYDGKLVFADGVPRTTKENTDFHGFGLKSVRMIVEKYDGSLKVTTLEDRFRIGIIFTL